MTAIRGLGEVAFRTERLSEMVAFYGEVLGLDRVDDPPFEGGAFFRASDGVAGHTQVLVLFDRSGSEGYVPPDGADDRRPRGVRYRPRVTPRGGLERIHGPPSGGHSHDDGGRPVPAMS